MNKILVVGASVAGLTSAFWLAKYGFEVSIIEKNSDLYKVGQIFNIRGAAFDVISAMGLENQIMNCHNDFKGARILNSLGKEIEHISSQPSTDISNVTLLRGEFIDILADATLSLSSVSISFNDTVEKIIPYDTHVVVKRKSGKCDTYNSIIGADGKNSRVRHLSCPHTVEYLPIKQQRICLWSIPNQFNVPPYWPVIYRAGFDVVISLLPVSQNRILCVNIKFPVPDEVQRKQSEWKQYTKEMLLRNSIWVCNQLAETLVNSTDFFSTVPSQIRLPKWYHKRIALVGDSAYCTSPDLGLGASNAVIGGYVLARSIAEYPENLSYAFLSYEREIRPVVEAAQSLVYILNDDSTNQDTHLIKSLMQVIDGYRIKLR